MLYPLQVQSQATMLVLEQMLDIFNVAIKTAIALHDFELAKFRFLSKFHKPSISISFPKESVAVSHFL